MRTSMWSLLDLSVLELVGNFSLKCNSGNSSFYHLFENDLLLAPRGLSAILPSRKYRATILLAVDQFIPIVAPT